MLELAKSALERDIPFDAPMESIDTPETRALLRETASNAVVLLKNDAGLLPIEDNVKSIAVIGYNARAAIQSGGGSAALLSTYTVSPLEGIEAIAAERGASVSFATGAAAYRFAPVIERDITAADGTAGTHIEFWKECPVESGDWWTDTQSELAQPYFTAPCTSTLAFCFDGVPYDELGRRPFCRMSFDFVPHATGNWLFGIVTIGYANLYVDGKLIVENVQSYEPGDMFFGLASEEQRGYCQLEQGRRYKIEVRQRTDPTLSRDGPFISRTCIRAGATLDLPEEDMRNEAAELAANSDVAIVVVGTNHDWEGEGFDRAEMKCVAILRCRRPQRVLTFANRLPGGNDALVTAVIKANPRTVVVTQSGAPVTMPWIEQAQTVMHSYFLGNEGSAIADIIFGKTAPSGKLSMTFPCVSSLCCCSFLTTVSTASASRTTRRTLRLATRSTARGRQFTARASLLATATTSAGRSRHCSRSVTVSPTPLSNLASSTSAPQTLKAALRFLARSRTRASATARSSCRSTRRQASTRVPRPSKSSEPSQSSSSRPAHRQPSPRDSKKSSLARGMCRGMHGSPSQGRTVSSSARALPTSR